MIRPGPRIDSETARFVKKPRQCSHLRVSINGFGNLASDQPSYGDKTLRILRGDCHDCGRSVERDQTLLEVETGTVTTKWKLRP